MKILMKISESIAIFLLGVGAVMGIINVTARYVLNKALIWGDEATLYIFICMIFLGVSSITYENRHLKTDFISQFIKPGTVSGIILSKIMNLLTVIISLLIAYYGIEQVITAFVNNRFSDSGMFPMSIVYASIPLGFICNALAGVSLLFRRPEKINKTEVI